MTVARTRQRELLKSVSLAFSDELDGHDPQASVPSDTWPTVRLLVDHLGGNYLWAAEIVRVGRRADRRSVAPAPLASLSQWFTACRAEAISAFDEADPDRPCWTLSDPAGVAAFWTRRMVFETTKHLIDLRGSGRPAFDPAGELDPDAYGDGIDELFEVFLSRTRDRLTPLPRPLILRATDSERRWTIHENWRVSGRDLADVTSVSAASGQLALFVWERADPLLAADRFDVDGPPDTVSAFRGSAVHP